MRNVLRLRGFDLHWNYFLDMDRRVNALFLYPGAGVPGGVVEYVETIRKYLPATISSSHLPVGSGRDEGRPLIGQFRLLIDAYKLFRILQKGDIDVVMLNPSFNFKSIVRDGFLLLICRASGLVPVLIQFHGWDFNFSITVKRSKIMRKLFSMCYNYATDIGVLSLAISREISLLGINPDKVRLSHTVFDGNALLPEREKVFDTYRFFFIARFVDTKGIKNLLKAFEVLFREHENISLTLAGDGPLFDWVRSRILTSGLSNRISTPGYIQGKEKIELLWSSNVFILPSETEGFPVALLEAMATGNAIIITSVGCVPDILEDEKNGVLMDGNSVEEIIAAVQKIMADDIFLDVISRENHSVAWEKYEAKKEAIEVEKRIYRLISKRIG